MKMLWYEFVVYLAPSLVLCISHVQLRLISFSIFIDSGLSSHPDALPGIPIPIHKVLNKLPSSGTPHPTKPYSSLPPSLHLLSQCPHTETTHPCSFVRIHRHTSIVTAQLQPCPFRYLFLSHIRPANGMFPLLPKYHRHNLKSIIMPPRRRRLAALEVLSFSTNYIAYAIQDGTKIVGPIRFTTKSPVD